jgi:hypothetical protein
VVLPVNRYYGIVVVQLTPFIKPGTQLALPVYIWFLLRINAIDKEQITGELRNQLEYA